MKELMKNRAIENLPITGTVDCKLDDSHSSGTLEVRGVTSHYVVSFNVGADPADIEVVSVESITGEPHHHSVYHMFIRKLVERIRQR